MPGRREQKWAAEATKAGLPVAAWVKGRKDAAEKAVKAEGGDAHILAVSMSGPWLEPKFPPGPQRTVVLHGGRYDTSRVDVRSLGQWLTVGGQHGTALYEHKDNDATTANYTAVDDDSGVPAMVPDDPPELALTVELEHEGALF